MIGMMTKWEYLRQLQFFSIWTRGKEYMYMIKAQNGFHGTNRPYRTHPPNVSQKRNLICILAPPFSLNHLSFSRYFAFLLYQTCRHTTQKSDLLAQKRAILKMSVVFSDMTLISDCH